MKLHRKKLFNTNLTMRGTLLKKIISKGIFVGAKVGDSVTLRNHIFDKLTGSSLKMSWIFFKWTSLFSYF